MLKHGFANSAGPIELTDNELETSDVITSFFDIMFKGTTIFDVRRLDSKLRSPRKLVVLFAQKYDFTHELRIIKYQLQTAIYRSDVGNRSPISVFNLGFMLDERKICADAIRKSGGGWNWSDGVQLGEEKIFGERLKGANVFDLSGYSLADLRLLPVEIIWALVRVCHRTSTLTAVEFKAESEAKAVAYTRLMALPGKISSSGRVVLTLIQVHPNSLEDLWAYKSAPRRAGSRLMHVMFFCSSLLGPIIRCLAAATSGNLAKRGLKHLTYSLLSLRTALSGALGS